MRVRSVALVLHAAEGVDATLKEGSWFGTGRQLPERRQNPVALPKCIPGGIMRQSPARCKRRDS